MQDTSYSPPKEPHDISYSTLQELCKILDNRTFSYLVLASSRQDNVQESRDILAAKKQVETLVGSRLASRSIDWRIILEELVESSSLDDLLISASKRDERELVSTLLEAGVNPGYSALEQAVRNNRVQVVSLLLSSGAMDPSVNNNRLYKIADRDGNWQVTEVLRSDRRVVAALA